MYRKSQKVNLNCHPSQLGLVPAASLNDSECTGGSSAPLQVRVRGSSITRSMLQICLYCISRVTHTLE